MHTNLQSFLLQVTYLSVLARCVPHTQGRSSRTFNGASFISGVTLRWPLLHLNLQGVKQVRGAGGKWVTHKPWSPARCSPLRRRPCRSPADPNRQSSHGWLRRSSRSWQESYNEESISQNVMRDRQISEYSTVFSFILWSRNSFLFTVRQVFTFHLWKRECTSSHLPNGSRHVSLVPPLLGGIDVHAPKLPVVAVARVLVALHLECVVLDVVDGRQDDPPVILFYSGQNWFCPERGKCILYRGFEDLWPST